MVTQIETPPMPTSVGGIVLSENSHRVLSLRFLREGLDGMSVESLDEMPRRDASHISRRHPWWAEMPEQVAAFQSRARARGRRAARRSVPRVWRNLAGNHAGLGILHRLRPLRVLTTPG